LGLLAVRVLLHATPTATRDLHFKVISERPAILTSECLALGEKAFTTYFKHVGFDAAGPSGARTHDLPGAKREHYHYTTATGIFVNRFFKKNRFKKKSKIEKKRYWSWSISIVV
jgi:hypothetical protein